MTDISKLLEKLDDSRKAYAEFKAKQEAEMLEAAKGLFTAVFESFDFLEAIVWTQYTPGFSDGDPCTFSVHDFYAMSAGYLEDEDMEGQYLEEVEYVIPIERPNYSYGEIAKGRSDEYILEEVANWERVVEAYGEENLKALASVLSSLASIPDKFYESFGEGLVVVSRDGIEVQEYDCGY